MVAVHVHVSNGLERDVSLHLLIIFKLELCKATKQILLKKTQTYKRRMWDPSYFVKYSINKLKLYVIFYMYLGHEKYECVVYMLMSSVQVLHRVVR